MVYFNTDKSSVGKIESGQAEKSSLTGFFKLNAENAKGADSKPARELTYEQLPTYFWWNKGKKEWCARKSKDKAVGRIFSVSYLLGERFYLCVLLLHQRNMHMFDKLKLVGNTLHETYQDTCNDLGLLVNNYLYHETLKDAYHETLKDASVTRPGFHVCQLFVMMAIHTPPLDPKLLFKKHFEASTDDIPQVDMSNRYSRLFTLEERQILALFQLNSILVDLNSNLLRCGITLTAEEGQILAEMTVDGTASEKPEVIAERLNRHKGMFTPEQTTIFKDITCSNIL